MKQDKTSLCSEPIDFKEDDMFQKFVVSKNFKVISGGQTGADCAGLDWAIKHGIAHGGWCPKGRRSENGVIGLRYQLTETKSPNYVLRTKLNVRDSDATLIFTLTEQLDGGSKKTAEFAEKLGKPWRHIHPLVHPKFIASFLSNYQVETLNIAGKRESSAVGISKWVVEMLDLAIEV